MRKLLLLNLMILFFFLSTTTALTQTKQETAPESKSGQPAMDDIPSQPFMTDIHDIKPPEKIEIDLKPLYYCIAIIFAILFLIVLYLFLKKYKKTKKQADTVSLSPHEIANMLLDELRDIENIQGKEFYFRLSAILRNYIHGRYGIKAPEMTTEELIPKIDEIDIDRELKKPLKDLLYSSEPVKFADIPAVVTKMHGDLVLVRDFVKRSSEFPELKNEQN